MGNQKQIKKTFREKTEKMNNREIIEWFKSEGCGYKKNGNVIELSHDQWGSQPRIFFEVESEKYYISTTGTLEDAEMGLNQELFITMCDIFLEYGDIQ